MTPKTGKKGRFTLTFDSDFEKLVQSFVKYLNDKEKDDEHQLKESDILKVAVMRWMQQEDFFRYLKKYDPELYERTQSS